jgi:spermidine synthase
MKNWELLGEASIPGNNDKLRLYQGKDDFFIRITSVSGELMSTRKYGSEEALGILPCRELNSPQNARVLIGGLGMGFTLGAILRELGPQAEVTVAELIPEVVEWNRGPLGERSGYPLNDPRTRVHIGDVKQLLQKSRACFDVIALDIDNGPEGLTTTGNDNLYTTRGILAAQSALTPGGILAYWSAGPDQAFHDRLRRCGFLVEEVSVFAHGKKGTRHTIWLASGVS